MATLLSIAALIVVLFVIVSVARWVFNQGGALLAAFVTLFLIIFAMVSVSAATLFAHIFSGGLQLLLLCSIVLTAIFIWIAWVPASSNEPTEKTTAP